MTERLFTDFELTLFVPDKYRRKMRREWLRWKVTQGEKRSDILQRIDDYYNRQPGKSVSVDLSLIDKDKVRI